MNVGTPPKSRVLAGALVAVTSIAAVVRLVVANTQILNYDEHIHLFVATVRPWSQFVTELRAIPHPPLSLLAFRLPLLFGDHPLVARLVSVVAAVATIPVFFICARRMGLAPVISLLGALALALAPAHVAVSVIVRGYSIATLFTLLAYASLLPLFSQPRRDGPAERRHLARWLTFSALAMWTEYSAWFVVFSMGTLLALANWRLLVCRWRGLLAFVVSALFLVGFVEWSVGVISASHVAIFFPGSESFSSFALVGAGRDFQLFSSLPVANSVVAALLAMAAVAFGPLMLRALVRGEDFARATAPLVCLQLVSILLVLAYMRIYPFGGTLRHQFVLFPFLLLCGLLLVERAQRVASVAALAMAYIGVLVWGVWALRQPFPEEAGWQPEFTTDPPRVVQNAGRNWIYVPTYSAFGLFGGLGDVHWSAQEECEEGSTRFLVTLPDRSEVTIIRDATFFMVPPHRNQTMRSRLTAVMNGCKHDVLWVYAGVPNTFGVPWRLQGPNNEAAPLDEWK